MKKPEKIKARKKGKETLEQRLNKPFQDDDQLMEMAWSVSTYVSMDCCSPVYMAI